MNTEHNGEHAVAGSQVTCPYCHSSLHKGPVRSKKCPQCGKTIRVRKGKLYTEDGLRRHVRTECHVNARQSALRDLRQWRESGVVQYVKIVCFQNCCEDCKRRNGKKVRIDDALKNMGGCVPPFESCKNDFCSCDIVAVLDESAL